MDASTVWARSGNCCLELTVGWPAQLVDVKTLRKNGF